VIFAALPVIADSFNSFVSGARNPALESACVRQSRAAVRFSRWVAAFLLAFAALFARLAQWRRRPKGS
jgi:hypothetical protein